MIGEAVARRTFAYREQPLAHRVPEIGPPPGVDRAADDPGIGRRKPAVLGILVRRLAWAEASTRGSA